MYRYIYIYIYIYIYTHTTYVIMCIYIYIYIYTCICKLVWSCTLKYSSAQTLVLTDVRTPFLGTPLVPSRTNTRAMKQNEQAHFPENPIFSIHKMPIWGSQIPYSNPSSLGPPRFPIKTEAARRPRRRRRPGTQAGRAPRQASQGASKRNGRCS